MAIVWVHELHDGRDGAADATGIRTYTRVFQVRTDDVATNARHVEQATGIPRLGDAYSTNDAEATCRSIKPSQQSESPYIWRVTVEYSSDPGTRSSATRPENPLDRPSVREWGFERISMPLAKDRADVAVRNSAGDQFDPLPEIDVALPVLRITKNEPSFDAGKAVRHVNTVNEDPFLGFAPGQAKMQSISARQQFQDGISYYEVTYEIAGRREGWNLEILDQGIATVTGGVRKAIMEAQHATTSGGEFIADTPVGKAVPLDGAGGKLAAGAEAVFIEFKAYDESDFGSLGLP